jgi:hypothetical protein
MHYVMGTLHLRHVMVLGIVGAALALAGCGDMSAETGGVTSAAGYVGDRTAAALNTIIVSVPADEGRYRNLAVTLAAVVNAKAPPPGRSSGDAFGSSVYDAEDIARRLEPRMAATVVELVQDAGPSPVGVTQLPRLRTQFSERCQQIVNDRMARWKYHDLYDVQIVVTSMYLTEPDEHRR